MSEKTRARWYTFLVFALFCVLSLIAGGYIGAHLASSAIVNNWVNSQTHYAQSHVLILGQLRNSETAAAIEQLEAQLDRDIVSLSPDYYEEFRVSDNTRARIEAVLDQVRQYRRSYPREKRGTAIEQDVERTLETSD
ncbi:MAG: hypothetical protein WD750_08630 [Gammaproteobacteria bacterium]